jgi:hypothetical protein
VPHSGAEGTEVKPQLFIETRLIHHGHLFTVNGGDMYRTTIKTACGVVIAQMDTTIDNRGGYGPPASYVIERRVRDEVARMLEFR